MSHPIIQDLEWRYTTKKFDPKRKVSPEDLAVLFEAMRLSPSSINSQPWKFIVIASAQAKQRMLDTFGSNYTFNQPHILDSSHIILFAHNPRYRREDFAEVVDNGVEDQRIKPGEKEGAFGAFFFAELNTDENGETGIWTRAQTYLALGNTLHTLARLKIDSTAMEGIDIERVNAEFAQELDGYHCDVALAIGYRDQELDHNATLPKSRRRLESVFVHL